jgi:hypothetical protein
MVKNLYGFYGSEKEHYRLHKSLSQGRNLGPVNQDHVLPQHFFQFPS